MIKVSILGGSGYTGIELLRILSRHPEVEIIAVTSRQYQGEGIVKVFPFLGNFIEGIFIDPSNQKSITNADIVFCCLPHRSAMEYIPKIIKRGIWVIDLSADFRLKDPKVYETWYEKHTAKDLLKKAVYGLPEIYRPKIKNAQLVANPGCYPTSAILGLMPLIKNKLIDTNTIIIDSKSGVSGAGREAKLETSFVEANEGFKAYKIGEHRHTPEIEQCLSHIAKEKITVSFSPHLLPVNRGILSTMYADIKTQKPAPAGSKQGSKVKSQKEMIFDAYKKCYSNEPFIRIMPEDVLPNIQQVKGSNFCDIGIKVDERTNRVVVVSVIDNLVKGASGQAVQNMNIMCGLHEKTGLLSPPLFP
ncbi:MAG: N-acetyl-gamma-glutamyl-phosphate reductase [Deltaproteobacteria bacterium]|nr:N-acetyl-gamma-glutamyl-phosphate reductase [Deltaproteobacteria bacterium]